MEAQLMFDFTLTPENNCSLPFRLALFLVRLADFCSMQNLHKLHPCSQSPTHKVIQFTD
jgi:hypothetical protein